MTKNCTEDKLILQDNLCKLCEWSKSWQLRFNTDKCKRMHIGKNERAGESYFMLSEEGEKIYLQEVAEEKDLGVIVRSNIKCSRVIGKAIRAMTKLNVLFKYMDGEIFKRIYPIDVRSHLESSVQACVLGDIDRLEKSPEESDQISERSRKLNL